MDERIKELNEIVPGDWEQVPTKLEAYTVRFGDICFEVGPSLVGRISAKVYNYGRGLGQMAHGQACKSYREALEDLLQWLITAVAVVAYVACEEEEEEPDIMWTVVYQDHDGTGLMGITNHSTKEGAAERVREIVKMQPDYLELAIEDGYDVDNDSIDDIIMLAEMWRHYTDGNEELEVCSGAIHK